ncbi:MAG: acyl-CoA dehydrogenase family protein [Sphingomonadaceae bacterium]
MSILYDEAQEAIASETRRVLDAGYDKARLLGLLRAQGEHDDAFWQVAREQGWCGIAIPEEHGGLGLGLVEAGLVALNCGAFTVGAPFLTTNFAATSALLAGTNERARAAWLPRLATGETIGTVAFAEAGSPLPVAPEVEYRDGALSGVKPGVVAGLKADCALVLARSEAGPVLVLAELAGVDRKPIESFDNARLFADLRFAATPATILAEGESAYRIARELLARMAVLAAHEQVGGAEAAMLAARDYALERKAFGQPIGAFQSVKHRIAELYGLVEIARANCIHAAALDGQPGFLAAAASARLTATEAYDTAARDAMQVHGGLGVTWEHGLHLHVRRARSLAIECGNALFWEDLLVGELERQAA